MALTIWCTPVQTSSAGWTRSNHFWGSGRFEGDTTRSTAHTTRCCRWDQGRISKSLRVIPSWQPRKLVRWSTSLQICNHAWLRGYIALPILKLLQLLPVMPLDGAIPFQINWGDTTHPSTVVPAAGRLAELVIEHPEPDRVRSVLAVLGAEVTVIAGDEFRLSAKIQTDDGTVILE